MRVIVAVLAAFCLFGFLAVSGPMDDAGMAFRIGYAVVGIARLIGTLAWIVSGRNTR